MEIVNKKQEDILNTARELFWKHGFRRVSIEEICKKAGVSKMTFYKYFPNKIELAKSLFNHVAHEGAMSFKEIMQADVPTSEKIKRIILMKTEGTNNISKEFMEDFYLGSEPELKAFVEETTRMIWVEILNDFKDAQQKGIFRSDFKPELMIQISFKFIEMMKDENIAQLYDTPQDMILEFANLITYGISPHQ